MRATSIGGPAVPHRPIVVAIVGLPGTGKSTIADTLAVEVGAPAFAGDWLLAALKPARHVMTQLSRTEYLDLYRSLLTSLVTRQCILGQSAIVDSVVSDDALRNWRETAMQQGHSFLVIECVCSNSTVHRQRIEGRQRGIPDWHEVGWDHVLRMKSETPPRTIERLTLDAIEPLESNLAFARAAMRDASSLG